MIIYDHSFVNLSPSDGVILVRKITICAEMMNGCSEVGSVRPLEDEAILEIVPISVKGSVSRTVAAPRALGGAVPLSLGKGGYCAAWPSCPREADEPLIGSSFLSWTCLFMYP